MTGWIIAVSIMLVLFLLSLLRLGAEVSYNEAGLTLRVRIGQIRITLYPRRKKPKKKPKKKATKKRAKKLSKKSEQTKSAPEKAEKSESVSEKKTQKEKKQEEEASNKGGLPLPLMDLISLILNAASDTVARLQIDMLEVGYTIAGKEDPAWAAIQYGLICAGEGGLVPVLENSFYCIKHRDIRARVDFEARTSLIWLRFALSIRLGQLISIACRTGWAFFKVYRQNQEGNDNGTETSDQ
ncbi:MAG: DUF2953 domain-containing protein [Candidatus Onthomonas sp.]